MNLTLIGMPGAGKSTVGRLLAERLGMQYVDGDSIMEEQAGKKLQDIVDEFGDEKFIELEAASILGLGALDNSVISPQGSVVYSPEAMEHQKTISTVIYLDVPLEVIKSRIHIGSRGIVGAKNKTLEELFAERTLLYRRYADRVIECGEESPQTISDRVVQELGL